MWCVKTVSVKVCACVPLVIAFVPRRCYCAHLYRYTHGGINGHVRGLGVPLRQAIGASVLACKALGCMLAVPCWWGTATADLPTASGVPAGIHQPTNFQQDGWGGGCGVDKPTGFRDLQIVHYLSCMKCSVWAAAAALKCNACMHACMFVWVGGCGLPTMAVTPAASFGGMLGE